MLPLRPIFSATARQRLMPLLVAIQVALACAILANVLFLLARQAAPLLVNDGIPRDRLLLVDQLVSNRGIWNSAQIREGADALRAVPGVQAVSPALGLPMKQAMTFRLGLRSEAGIAAQASGFSGEDLRQALGLELVRGRDFVAADYYDLDLMQGVDLPQGVPVILTEKLAQHLFPDGEAIGSTLTDEDGSKHLVVVGTVRHLLRYELDRLESGQAEFSILLPGRPTGVPVLSYAVIVDPGLGEGIGTTVADTLAATFEGQLRPGINPQVDRYEDLYRKAFAPRRAALWMLGTVIAVVLLVTGIGIAGLSAYWVQQRIRQVGIRRALGATQAQVIGHFLAENALVVVIGLVPGMLLAFAINQWLMTHYELPRLPLHYLPIGALALWLLGQLAVLGPALRASSVPPAIATRSV